MKRFCSLLLSALLLMGTLTACGGGAAGDTEKDTLSVVTTIFPEYDWVMNVLGDKASGADVTMLLDSGVDLHSYQPTADDMIRVASCDLFIYVGGESDEWVEDALKGARNENMVALNLMDVLGSAVKEEEVREGMEFVLAGEHRYPDDYPSKKAVITVVGEFETYYVGSDRYCRLCNAEFV